MQMSHSKPPRRSSNLRSRGIAEKLTYRETPIQPPNVIARLMGIDAIPTPPPKPAAAVIQPQPTSNLKPPASSSSSSATKTKVISPRSEPFRQAKCSLLSYRNRNGDASSRHCLNKMRVPGRSRSRQHRHPHEDLLEKIKHDFQAWQTSKALDNCSATAAALRTSTAKKTLDLDGRSIQMIAQENLRKEKMARYGFANSKVLENVVQDADSEHAANEAVAAEPKPEGMVITVLRASPCAASEEFRDFEAGKADGHEHNASGETLRSATPIVLLEPGSDTGVDGQEPLLFGLPKVKRDGNISRFLQEVKEMLQKELDVNAKSDLNALTWGAQPKQITKQTKETVAKDLNKRLFRLESFRAFRSDRKRNEATAKQASPEHVRIVTRSIIVLAHRLKSVTSRTETVSPKNDDEESMSSCSITSRQRVRSLADASPSGIGLGDQSFRSECLVKDKDESDGIVPSARALFRSFSAPESGFPLGSLFGDGSSTTREAPEGAAAMTSKNNTSFSFIRGTVLSLRHRFSLRRNIFRRKMHWSKKTSLGLGELHPQMAIGTEPPSPETFNLFKVAQANLTELPPSPVSPLEVVGHSCRHFFSDFTCTLPELSPKCLSELGAPAGEVSFRTDITVETACNHDKAYIREILVAAGLHDDGSLDNRANSRVDSMARPICDDIFEEVEDIYYYRGKYCDDAMGTHNDAGGNATDHRLLFDLANEALQSLVQGAKSGSSLQQWVVDSTGVSRGRRLVDDVWQQVQTLRNPRMQEMQTIDSMVAYEIRNSVWAEVLYEDVYVVGRKIERAIFDELIEDLFLIEVFI